MRRLDYRLRLDHDGICGGEDLASSICFLDLPASLKHLQPFEPRTPTADERQLIDQLLRESFAGRDELRIQLADVHIVACGVRDTRTLVFDSPSPDSPRANTDSRVPVDAVMADDDGTDIEVLLHVIDGYARELEIYRVDGAPITRELLDGPLKLVNWGPGRSDQPG